MLDLRATKYYIRSQNSVTIVTIYYKIKDQKEQISKVQHHSSLFGKILEITFEEKIKH